MTTCRSFSAAWLRISRRNASGGVHTHRRCPTTLPNWSTITSPSSLRCCRSPQTCGCVIPSPARLSVRVQRQADNRRDPMGGRLEAHTDWLGQRDPTIRPLLVECKREAWSRLETAGEITTETQLNETIQQIQQARSRVMDTTHPFHQY